MLDSSQRLLAHRGLWGASGHAPNSLGALVGAIKAGFGIETDIRDVLGSVVVSHDPPIEECISLLSLLSAMSEGAAVNGKIVALNVKSDGLLRLLDRELSILNQLQHFFFDLSTPELHKYAQGGVATGFRVSEFESVSTPLFEASKHKGIWLDSFSFDWWGKDDIEELNALNVPVVIVSPELHGRDPSAVWEFFSLNYGQFSNLFLCTDHPHKVLEMMRGV